MTMNYKLFSVLSFMTGAAIGSAITWKIAKTKYERIAQEEIDSVKEVFSRRKHSEEECEADSTSDEMPTDYDVVVKNLNSKPDIMEYASKLNKMGYTGSVEESEEESEVEEDMRDKPYVISADEFDEIEEYEVETLTYYADGVLTDWYNEIIEDVEDVVGLDALENFDKYAADGDTVFVRNDSRECDYEIQRDTRNYADLSLPE